MKTSYLIHLGLVMLMMLPVALQADPGIGSPRPGKSRDEEGPQKLIPRDEFLKKVRNGLIEQIEQGARSDKLKEYLSAKFAHRLEVEKTALFQKAKPGAKVAESKIRELEENFRELEGRMMEEMEERIRKHQAKRESDAIKAQEAKKDAVIGRIETALKNAERLNDLAETGDVEAHHKLISEWGLAGENDGRPESFRDKLSRHRTRVEEQSEALIRRRESVLEESLQAAPLHARIQRKLDREELIAKRQKLDAEGYDEETIRLILGMTHSD